MEFPTTLLDFADQFPDEDACWSYLKAVRWPDGFGCPRCGSTEASYLQGRRLFQCSACRYQAPVTSLASAGPGTSKEREALQPVRSRMAENR